MDKRTKQEIIDFLVRCGIIAIRETGQVVIHLNEGGITKVVKTVEVK